MAWNEGDLYVCPEPNCGCEVIVRKGPDAEEGETQPPTCARGHRMVRKEPATT